MSLHLKCWYQLNIDVSSAIRKDFVWPDIDSSIKRREWFYKDPTAVLTTDFTSLMFDRKSPLTSVIIFYRGLDSNHGWAHIDINAKRYVTTCALNWAIGGTDSTMHWYKDPNIDLSEKDIAIAPGNTHSLTFPIGDLTEIDQCHIGNKLTLTRTDIPHTVFVNNDPRWCISVRFGGRYQTWEDAVSDFRKDNIIISL